MTPLLVDAFKLINSEHDKIVSPEMTIEQFKERAKAAKLNILKETRRIDNNRLGIPVYYSVCGHDASCLTGTKKQMGKGVTPALAEASAVMELAERFSLYSFMGNTSNFVTSTYDKIKTLCSEKGGEPIPFSLILKSVHDNIENNIGGETYNGADKKEKIDKNNLNRDIEIKEKIFSMLRLKWTKAYNYSKDQEMLIPLDWFFMINEFNGSSAGNCNEEAICQGGCEIIERHVSALICRDKIQVPYIDPDSVTNPSTVELIKKFRDAGIKFYIHDFSLNTGIPTVGVIAWDPSTFPKSSEIVWTAGTAPSPDKALSRALTEVAQLAGDFNSGSNYVASGLPKFTSLEQASWLIEPIENGISTKVKITDLPDISNRNIKDEISSIIKAMSKLNFELIVVNTTDPRLLIPACYTVVPGACFRERAENSNIAMFAARHLHNNLSSEKAFELIGKIAKMLPNRYEIEFYLGLCLLDMENPEQAISHFQAAMNLNPADQDIPSICSYTGVCFKELGIYDKAIEVLEKGIAVDSERDDIYNLMGFCHFMLKNHKKSIVCFENVIKLNPSSAIDHASIGSNYRELGDIEKAIAYYELALALDPTLDFARQNIEKLQK
ncbi:MAG: YcaO-like family protein [Desulfamplus sp.]|nr:YcaO-like family protein [Desulfamplus sp.]